MRQITKVLLKQCVRLVRGIISAFEEWVNAYPEHTDPVSPTRVDRLVK